MYIQSFLQMLKAEKGLSKNTIESYKTDLKKFEQFFKGRALYILSSDEILKYLSDLKDRFHERTVARHISALKQFYLFLVRDKIIKENPLEHIKAPNWKPNLPKFLTEDEVNNILLFSGQQGDAMFHVMLELLYATGMRISELVSLPKKHVLKKEKIWVILIKGKGGKERIVPINDIAKKSLEKYLTKLPEKIFYLFPSRASSGHITRQSFGQKLKIMALQANVEPTKVSPHVIRHAFATHMLKYGANLVLIKEFLGHANLSTSEVYLHVLPEDLKDLIEQYHPLNKGIVNI